MTSKPTNLKRTVDTPNGSIIQYMLHIDMEGTFVGFIFIKHLLSFNFDKHITTIAKNFDWFTKKDLSNRNDGK